MSKKIFLILSLTAVSFSMVAMEKSKETEAPQVSLETAPKQATKQERLLQAILVSQSAVVTDIIKDIDAHYRYPKFGFRKAGQIIIAENVTPLMIAILCNADATTLRALIRAPLFDPYVIDGRGAAAIHYACMQKNSRALSVLLSFYNDEKHINLMHKGYTPLIFAFSGATENITLLCKTKKIDMSRVFGFSEDPKSGTGTALHIAVTQCLPVKVIRELVDAGVDIHSKTSQNGLTALEIAWYRVIDKQMGNPETKGFVEIIKALLALGAPLETIRPQIRDLIFMDDVARLVMPSIGHVGRPNPLLDSEIIAKTCLFLPCMGHFKHLFMPKLLEIPKMLSERHGDINCAIDPFRMTALMWAAIHNLTEPLVPHRRHLPSTSMIPAASSAQHEDGDGNNFEEVLAQTMFLGVPGTVVANELFHLSPMELLLACPQINVNAVDEFGDTALHYAARCGHVQGARLLLLDPKTISGKKNNDSKSPLDLAQMNKKEAVIRTYEELIKMRAYFYWILRNSEPFGRLDPKLLVDIARLVRYKWIDLENSKYK